MAWRLLTMVVVNWDWVDADADVGNGSESSVGDRVSVSNLGAVQSLIGVQLRVSALTFPLPPSWLVWTWWKCWKVSSIKYQYWFWFKGHCACSCSIEPVYWRIRFENNILSRESCDRWPKWNATLRTLTRWNDQPPALGVSNDNFKL